MKSKWVKDYTITFWENGSVIGNFVVAVNDSLVAESIGRKMAAEGVIVTVN